MFVGNKWRSFFFGEDRETSTNGFVECVEAKVCSYEMDCGYYDYTEMCGIESSANVTNYLDNCVAVAYIVNGNLFKELKKETICRPSDIGDNRVVERESLAPSQAPSARASVGIGPASKSEAPGLINRTNVRDSCSQGYYCYMASIQMNNTARGVWSQFRTGCDCLP